MSGLIGSMLLRATADSVIEAEGLSDADMTLAAAIATQVLTEDEERRCFAVAAEMGDSPESFAAYLRAMADLIDRKYMPDQLRKMAADIRERGYVKQGDAKRAAAMSVALFKDTGYGDEFVAFAAKRSAEGDNDHMGFADFLDSIADRAAIMALTQEKA